MSQLLSPEEYLALERKAEYKSEYLYGENIRDDRSEPQAQPYRH